DVYTAPIDLNYFGPQPQAQEAAGSQQVSVAGQEQVFADVDTTIFRPGLYLESNMQLGKLTQLILGLRMDYFSAISSFSVDPRLTTIFTVADDMRVKLGVGIFSQPPEFQESDVTIGNPDLDPIKARRFTSALAGSTTRFRGLGLASKPSTNTSGTGRSRPLTARRHST
ncbi:MAG: TonB-dependent receptor, partial [Deltaproteobacteria bacterium]|nr:TonB-dependent receptor [Deltaproteobacteria bacterium]